jgi:2-polyprenyl-3-methyl-5-hydroxy-6-metoxy-1,4-benzoquinol methylase
MRRPMHFARGKLRHDPVFRAILAHGLVPDGARLVDLGCGQGVLPAFLISARACNEGGAWPTAWPPPPRLASMLGVDLRRRAIAAARVALGDRATFEVGDVRDAVIPACDVVVILDVLHYVPVPDQDRVLARCAAALAPGGRLLLRVGDADAGTRAAITRLSDQAITLLRGGWPRLYTRGLKAWIAAVERVGFGVAAAPMSAGTPFANVLLVARRNV